MRRPRFQSRPFFRKFINSNKEEEDIKSFILKVSQKDIILDYSQLRIGCFHFLLKALPKGSTVATSCYTIFDMVNIIISAGHKPFFVDIDMKNLGPNISEIEKLVQSKSVDAVIYTHLHGYKADLKMLSETCKKNNCILIEDCAQSLWNTTWDQKSNYIPGKYGDASIYSSGFFKNINTICGGLVAIKNDFDYSQEIINSYKYLKPKITYDFIYRSFYGLLFKIVTTDLFFNFLLFPVLKISWAKNLIWINKRAREENNPRYIHRDNKDVFRMNLLQRFILKFQNKKALDNDYFIKRNLAKIYLNELKDLIDKKIIYIPGVYIKNSEYSLDGIASYNQIPILTNNRKKLLNFLISEGFDIAAQHIRNLSRTAPYNKYKKVNDKNASYVVDRIILLPCYPTYKEKNVYDLCKKIKSFYHDN
tara:strand:+ start:1393 stop:2652 length:1260 start_codon:yes stop_codon:yes gene_type:complete